MQLKEKDVLGLQKKRVVRRVASPKIISRPTTAKTPHATPTQPERDTTSSKVSAVPDKKPWLPVILDAILSWTLAGMVFLVPIFFLPTLSEPLELAKQSLLFIGTFILATCYGLKIITTNAFSFRGGAFMIGALCWLAAWLVASLFSLFPHNSFVGLNGQQVMSFTSLLSYMILAFVISQAGTVAHFTRTLTAFFASTTIVSIVGVLQIFNIFILPWDITKTPAFNPAGRLDLWGVLVAVSVVLAILQLIRASMTDAARAKTSIALAVYVGAMLILLVILNDWRVWLSLFVGLVISLVVLFAKLPKDKKVGWIVVPSFVVILSATMLVLRPHILPLPPIVQPSLATSTTIAAKTIQSSPITGYGPGNFITSFTRFRPIDSNKDNYLGLWTARFDQSSSFFISAVAASGIVGLFGMLAFLFLFLRALITRLVRDTFSEEYLVLLMSGAGVIVLLIANILKPSNITLSFILWVLIGFCGSLLLRTVRVMEARSNRFLILTAFSFTALVCAGLTGLLFMTNRLGADMAYARALHIDRAIADELRANQKQPDQKNIDELIGSLTQAVSGDQKNPVYATALSQAFAYQLNGLLASTNQQSEEKTAQLQNITSNMIDVARLAYTTTPHDIRTVENIAGLYQNIAPYTAGADDLAIEFFKKAADLDPTNPAQHLARGRFLLTMSLIHGQRAEQTKTDQADIKIKEQEASESTLKDAEDALQQTLTLKDDYAEALYTMALARAQQKNTTDAISYLDKAMIANVDQFNFGNADAGLFLSMGSSYAGLGEKEKGEIAYKNALSVSPDFADAKWLLALLYAEQGRKQEAISLLNDLAKKNPNNEMIAKKITELQAGSPEGVAPTQEPQK
ncbi:MAG: tetratricopeptide repeat protein [Candidatus Uhrbacteria bacterium]|nr:tetratricopeptide repeat protein [Candidatus Uhrbacteria bacterium]